MKKDTARTNPRLVHPRVGTEERILDAAEQLFGLHGIHGVSLRQVAQAAGASNNVAVQYHFGDRDGLVAAIFRRRLPAIEQRTVELLSRATEQDKLGDPRTLIEALLRPLAEQHSRDGTRSYSALLLGLNHFEGSLELRRQMSHLAPLTTHVSSLLRSALTQRLPYLLFRQRIGSASDAFNRCVVTSSRGRQGGPQLSEELWIQEALDIALAIMTAPVRAEILTAFEEAETA